MPPESWNSLLHDMVCCIIGFENNRDNCSSFEEEDDGNEINVDHKVICVKEEAFMLPEHVE